MKNNTRIMIALAAGALIGGMLGLMFAPDKGKELRKKMKEQSKKMKRQADDFLSEAKERVYGIKKEGSKMEGELETMIE